VLKPHRAFSFLPAWVTQKLSWTVWVFFAIAFSLARAVAITPALVKPDGSELSAAVVAAFANRQIPAAMRAGEIPGAVFAVVQDNRVIFQSGYGLANVQRDEPVSVSNTLFRAASISKVLTAASVLHLAQERRLDLDCNVNDYLDGWHIASAFDEPITLADLLTHSGGFDVCRFDYAAQSRAQKLSLRNYLIQFQPLRVRPPGMFSVYDNYGYTLAGYLVQKISGTPFSRYVQQWLLHPLDMNHSSFFPTATLRKWLATGYRLEGKNLQPYPPDHVNITPAAGLCTTAADMSRFLVALLTDQSPNGSRIFSSGMMKDLETQQFTANPEVPGRCYGFDEITLAGRQVLEQTGQWPGFNSLLLLFPGQHCGLFLAYNLCDQLHLGREISRQFAQQFFPAKPIAAAAKPSLDSKPANLESLCGYYLSDRFPEETPSLHTPGEMDVTPSSDGELEINDQPYRAIAPLVFEKIVPRNIPGRRVAFRLGQNGEVADLITERGTFHRADWSETKSGRTWLLRLASLIFVSVVVLWPAKWFVRQVLPATAGQPSFAPLEKRRNKLSIIAQTIAFIACLLALWFEASLALTELRLDPFAEFYGMPGSIKHLFAIMPVLMALAAAALVFSWLAWQKRLWHPWQRLHYTLVPVALLLFFYIFYCRHLLFIA
jgi:CubicO group peptidase (beta-lactamase class C family)